ncbi:MAG TPA: HlyD family efflux transporter periplasmic adaptor subunit, partial [Gemmatimonadaceae bacterium]|nr:HlyD family efflux transporter periplasmic adaptor subunit [Gemmatimonadaceae bacterium]
AAGFLRRTAAIVAPAAGVVLRRLAEPNAVVAAGQPVLVVRGEGRGVVLRAGLSDRDAVRVRVGDPAEIRFAALPEAVARGRVSEVGAAAMPGTGAYEVEVTIDAGPALVSGLVGTVEIRPARTEEIALVPVDALVEGDADSAQVFSVAPDGRHARRHVVRLAWLRGGTAAVRAGLDGVTAVVTDGSAYLADGALVRRAEGRP